METGDADKQGGMEKSKQETTTMKQLSRNM